jgi:hypothetical protein
MVMTCPKCNQLVKSTDGFCESCGFKIDSISNRPSPASNIKKVCKNEKCPKYNAEYGIDDKYCGKCGSKLAVEGQEDKPPVLEKREDKPPVLEKRGFLVMPDTSQIEITPTETTIGRIDLSKYVSEGERDYISRDHITVFKDGEKYYVQDGKSTNKTWVISGGQQKEEITGKGRWELKDGDQISIANTVTLSFTLK